MKARRHIMSKTQEVIELLQDYQASVGRNESSDTGNEYCNHWVRRFFRCWIDGSYNGFEHYKANCETIKLNKDNPKRLRAFVINQLCQFISREFDCSYSTSQKAITKALNTKQLEALNQELIEDSLELIEGL